MEITVVCILCLIIGKVSTSFLNDGIIEFPIRVRRDYLNVPNNTNLSWVNIQQLSCTNKRTYVFVQRGYMFGYTLHIDDNNYRSNITCNVTLKHGLCKIVNNTVCDTYKIDGVYNTARYNYKVLYTIACRNRNHYIWGSSVLRVYKTCFKIKN